MAKDNQNRFREAVTELGTGPFSSKNVKRLHGKLEGLCRYRVGSFRMVFRIIEDASEIRILAIASRGDVYK